ncbi:MAG: hypothetical protein V7646_6200 [Pseudonocardia sp.]
MDGPGRASCGAPRYPDTESDLEFSLVPDATAPPPEFRQAVASLRAMRPRPELIVSALDAPPRLAPYTWAFSVEADASTAPGEELDEPDTSGRLILLHDPAGQDAWEGTFRLVCFVQARLDPEQLGDEMLPVVGWSWLTEALDHGGAEYVALGGTVTQTSSVRFGDIAGPRRDDDVELRASWTPTGPDLSRHAEAFCALIASAAGLPPVGILPLAHRTV